MTEAMILDSEAAVIANFEFLAQADSEMSEDDMDDMSDEIGDSDDTTDMKTTKRKAKGGSVTMNDGKILGADGFGDTELIWLLSLP